MQICRSIAAIRDAVAGFRAEGHGVGLVTTMGALHEGHMSLVAAAKRGHDRVVATIFVNPTQFGDPKDLETYPRTESADLAMLEAAGCDAVLIPRADEIYPQGDETIVETQNLAMRLHGAVRPGHFRGVATVVTKLFNITRPDAAYFGEKDYQQLQVIRRMATDLHMGIDIHGVPTLREADGLAMSSRNVRLTAENRAAALCLSRALDRAERMAAERASPARIEAAIRATIADEPRATLTGLDMVAPESLAPLRQSPDAPLSEPIAIMISAQFGEVLLIDQREIAP
ncbi:pantoate--beta-alanine ligase [Limimaricola cinnabarinus]|jgi:pantoate--beta-alanine ligase|uniref:Pantothenate synthetase n=1 Tax=Limimaricola cinnabarinus TaxID=1125964 RepID=A0A2G1MIQ8_9RHOB|nr:pantoate--beta-alanine ligase [Limimaricola cinnabarinus]PHP28628.1 pantoate--beta-alanine ligase [Limimaricola cinnabarinus]